MIVSRWRNRRASFSAAGAWWTLLVVSPACDSRRTVDAGSRAAHAPATAFPAAPEESDYPGLLLSRSAMEVVSSVDGIVRELPLVAGARARHGEVVLRVESLGLRKDLEEARGACATAHAETRATQIELELATRALRRADKLGDLVSSAEREALRGQVDQQAARAEKARVAEEAALTRMRYYERLKHDELLVAPFDSRLSVYYVRQGASVHAGERLARLVGTEEYRIRFAVPPADATVLTPGTEIAGHAVVGGWRFSGSIEGVSPEVDAPSGLIFVEARVDDAPGAHPAPGLAVRVHRTRGKFAREPRQIRR